MKKLHTFFSKRLFILAIVSFIVLTLSQLFGRYVWQLELFSHFVPYYAVVLLLAGFIFPKIKNKNHASLQNVMQSIFLFVGMALLMWCLPSYQMLAKWYQMLENVDNSTTKETLIAYQNVNISNTSKEKTLKALTQNNPETLILLEAGGDWSGFLSPLEKEYSVRCADNQFSPFAMQVFSKNEKASCELTMIADLPMIRLKLDNQRIIYVIHPPPPINSELAKTRLIYLQTIHDMVINEIAPVMVIGDMNATAFSPVYRDFIEGTGLQKSMANGIPTWIPFFIGIDHVLTSQSDKTSLVTLLNWYGSDHRGFEVNWEN